MEKIYSMPLSGELSLKFYLDKEGKPINVEGNKSITDENLLAVIEKFLITEEAKDALTLRIGNDMLKYVFMNDTPVYIGNHQPIQDPMVLKAIKADEQKRLEMQKKGMLGVNGITDNFKGLPMRELIGAPLFAAAEAQEKLASVAWDYYQRIAYDTDGKTRLLTFDLERPVVEGGVVAKDPQKLNVKAPFIGLVPIPSLLIDHVDVDFQMEVTDTNTSTDKIDTSVDTNVSSKWFGVNVSVAGKVSSSRENTRSTNQTAKYQVHVSASQQPQTEGLSKLMDVMATCIEPIPTDGSSGGK